MKLSNGVKIIVGLGNPGKQYEKTRHNAGFMAVDALAKELNLKWEKSIRFKAEIAKGQGFIFLKPQTFMNNSGQAVAALLAYFKLPPDKGGVGGYLTVIHDDLDIVLGKYKVSTDSRSAGHNGVQSIIDQLKTKNFKRIRVGIKAPALEKIPADLARRNEVEAAKFVLQKFSGDELKIIKNLISQIIKEFNY